MTPESVIKAQEIKFTLKQKLDANQRSFSWFHKNRLQGCGGIYPSFMNMLNGNSNITAPVAEEINKYLGERF